MERKNQKQKFQELLKKMDALQETEKGKLKGGFTTIKSTGSNPSVVADYGICGWNKCMGTDNYGICIGNG